MRQAGRVSIIMPVYNGAEYIRQAVESVFSQSYQDWELIVVDDGSTDESATILNTMDDPRLHYTYQENRGQAAALNRGLELAEGEFITTLDADDWLPDDSLQNRVECLTLHPECGAAYADGLYCNAAGEILMRFSEHMPAGLEGDVYDTLIVSPFYGTGAAVLLRQETLARERIRYDDEIVWCQDWDLYIRLAEKTHFRFVSTPAVFYRLHSAGMTLTMPAGRRLESLIRLRLKVMSSSRFKSVSEPQKGAFFYDFLIKDLHGRTDDQELVFKSPAFRSLTPGQRSRLLRLTAIEYLVEEVEPNHIIRKWLWSAWKASPLDPKTALVTLLSLLNTDLARKVVLKWKSSQGQEGDISPFELAGANQKL